MADYGVAVVHGAHPKMDGWGSLNASRSGNRITVSGTAYMKAYYGYGYHYAAQILWCPTGGSWYLVGNHFYIKDNNSYTSGEWNTYFSEWWDDSRSGSIGIRYLCCGIDGVTPDQCSEGYPHYDFYNVTSIGSAYSGPSTYVINSIDGNTTNTSIKKLSEIRRNFNYSISGGTNSIDWVAPEIYPGNASWNYGIYNLTNMKQATRDSRIYPPASVTIGSTRDDRQANKKYKLFDGGSSSSVGGNASIPPSNPPPATNNDSLANFLQAGKKYKLAIHFSDNSSEWVSGNDKEFYVYQQPTINNSITRARATQNANQDNSFTISGINNAVFTSNGLEKAFQTRYRYKIGSGNYNSWTNLGNITKWTRTAAQMRSLVPYSATNDGATVTIQMERYSPSAVLESVNKPTTTIVVYYRPRTPVTNPKYNKNNASGNQYTAGQLVVNDDSLISVYVSWVYDLTSANAGYTEGYRVRLYDKDNNIVKTYYTTNKYYNIPKADIPKLQMTKVDITPYYANGQTKKADASVASNYIYYNGTITQYNFVQLVGQLAKPVITYPVNNANWINRQARVCFQLPKDYDVENGNISSTGYTYENLELKVNNRIYTLASGTTGASSGAIVDTTIFSTTTLSYQQKLVVFPNLNSNLPIVEGVNRLQLRVKKRPYDSTDSTDKWSVWSDEITFNVTIPSYSVNVGDKILASHFNNIKEILQRSSATYGINWIGPDTAQAFTTKIAQAQYTYNIMFKTIVDTKYAVNNYTDTYDTGKEGIKFDSTNQILENFTTYPEYVTAAANESANDGSGRNYMQIAFNRVTKLV